MFFLCLDVGGDWCCIAAVVTVRRPHFVFALKIFLYFFTLLLTIALWAIRYVLFSCCEGW